MNLDTYIIVAAYNESQVIGGVISNLHKHFKNVICVNDGSTDKTEQAIINSNAIAISHPINLGQGAAIQTGIDYALAQQDAKYFVTFDADGQHSPEDALRMIDYLKNENLDIVLGSRFLGTAKNITLFKKTLLRAARLFSRFVTGVNLTDTHVGLRAFNRRFAESLNITMNGMSHATEIIDRIKQYKFAYKEIPVTITYSDYSKAKGQSMLNSVNIAVDIFLGRIMK